MSTTEAPDGEFSIFIVTAGQFDSFCYEAAFSTRALAEQYISSVSKPRNRFEHVNPTVLEMPVHRSPIPEQYDDLPADWPAELQSLPTRFAAASDSPPVQQRPGVTVGLGLVPPTGPNPTPGGAE